MAKSEMESFGESIRSTFNALETIVFSKSTRCRRCGDEYAVLSPSHLCIECDKANEDQSLVKKHLGKMLSPFAMSRFTLESFLTPSGDYLEAKNVALKFRPDQQNLYAWGPCGSGKSHLAIALMQEWAGAVGGSVQYERMTELMRFIRGMRGDEEAGLIERLAARKILVLDDLGVGRGTEFALAVAYEIIEARAHRGRAGLIITSNLGPDALADKFGDDRLSSRIGGSFNVLHMDLPDWRIRDEAHGQAA